MPVEILAGGWRSVQAETEVPGTPEDVWQAVATGPGISSWFVPTTVEGRVGGTTTSSFGPGMDSTATITAWDPPRRFVAEAEGGPGKVETEWVVEAREGGRCVVRVVHRWPAGSDGWDAVFEGQAYGWATSFLPMLRLYLAHFRGQRCAAFQLSAFSLNPVPTTWKSLKGALSIDRAARRVETAPGAPALSGVLEGRETRDPELLRIRETAPQVVAALEGMEGEDPELLIRLERPAPGLAHFMARPMGHETLVSVRFHLFGEQGTEAAPGMERQWRGWLAARFPHPSP